MYWEKVTTILSDIDNYTGFIQTVFFNHQIEENYYDLSEIMNMNKIDLISELKRIEIKIVSLKDEKILFNDNEFNGYNQSIESDLLKISNSLQTYLVKDKVSQNKLTKGIFNDFLDLSKVIFKLIDGNIKMIYAQESWPLIDNYRGNQRGLFSKIFQIYFGYLFLRVCQNKGEKQKLIQGIIYNYNQFKPENRLIFNGKLDLIYSSNIDVVSINSLADFIKVVTKHKNDELFYRGHASINYAMIPSVYRGFHRYEHDMINDLRIAVPEEFPNNMDHFEMLLKMQHYGLPTRLIDLTSNPLVALFFACEDKEHNGQVLMIKPQQDSICYPQSDRLKLLSAYSFIKNKQKDKLRIYLVNREESTDYIPIDEQRALMHEIKTFYPAFEERINKSDLLKPLIIKSPQSNPRISAQNGSFIISPINQSPFKEIELDYLKNDDKRLLVVINMKNKKKIENELIKVNIYQGSLFPEISNKTLVIKEKYANLR